MIFNCAFTIKFAVYAIKPVQATNTEYQYFITADALKSGRLERNICINSSSSSLHAFKAVSEISVNLASCKDRSSKVTCFQF